MGTTNSSAIAESRHRLSQAHQSAPQAPECAPSVRHRASDKAPVWNTSTETRTLVSKSVRTGFIRLTGPTQPRWIHRSPTGPVWQASFLRRQRG